MSKIALPSRLLAAALLICMGNRVFSQSGDDEIRATATWRPQAPEMPEGRPQVDLGHPGVDVDRPDFKRPGFGQGGDRDDVAPLRESRAEQVPQVKVVEVPQDRIAGRDDPVPLPDTMVQPQYPSVAVAKGVEGYVELLFTVSADGKVTEVTIAEAKPAGVFNQAVLDAILEWRFKPAVEDGEPVAHRVSHRFDFSIGQ